MFCFPLGIWNPPSILPKSCSVALRPFFDDEVFEVKPLRSTWHVWLRFAKWYLRVNPPAAKGAPSSLECSSHRESVGEYPLGWSERRNTSEPWTTHFTIMKRNSLFKILRTRFGKPWVRGNRRLRNVVLFSFLPVKVQDEHSEIRIDDVWSPIWIEAGKLQHFGASCISAMQCRYS